MMSTIDPMITPHGALWVLMVPSAFGYGVGVDSWPIGALCQ
ncbi:hypothetical protein Intca_2991 [Intrasporangium calvum DSM 43043]|uniref:Uncharacterized protein n=1 Tax=Intrasporangium calvum (strain ATCC 23552 / DSM 43043 / JCM 3097 / NBRC 12989 / NCIMB 10167 / NRRL B-3866 / 7 KIP) TaxID=710696 RepID=E6SBF4_INTC7|nr:hypothetical protein Intca_2991 [Intrasporangium calvum DSM 43043]